METKGEFIERAFKSFTQIVAFTNFITLKLYFVFLYIYCFLFDFPFKTCNFFKHNIISLLPFYCKYDLPCIVVYLEAFNKSEVLTCMLSIEADLHRSLPNLIHTFTRPVQLFTTLEEGLEKIFKGITAREVED